MEKENDLVRIESEDGKTYDMLILKEFMIYKRNL